MIKRLKEQLKAVDMLDPNKAARFDLSYDDLVKLIAVVEAAKAWAEAPGTGALDFGHAFARLMKALAALEEE